MAYLDNHVYDNGLSILNSDTTHLHILSQEPTSFADVATYTLGNKAAPTVGSPASGSPDGRQVSVSAITDGTVTATGVATHYALVDNTNSRLLVAKALNAGASVTNGGTFTLTALVVRIPAPV